MFSKAKDNDNPTAQAASPQARRVVKSAPSIISNDMTVHGSLSATGDIQVDGKVEGDIESGSLTIGEKATVHGEVTGEDVIIRGRVIGSVRANRVHLAGTAHVEGDIFHQALAVETGAFFEGNCRHSENPRGESGGGRRKRGGGVKNLISNQGGDEPAPVKAAPKREMAPPKPAQRGKAPRGRTRGQDEAQSALSRLTGSKRGE